MTYVQKYLINTQKMMYNRPIIEDLKEAMEIIAK